MTRLVWGIPTDNILVALSNMACLYPVLVYLIMNTCEADLVLGILLLCSGVASAGYHLLEHTKHGMPGLYGSRSPGCEHGWLNVDRFFAVVCSVFVLLHTIRTVPLLTILHAIGIECMLAVCAITMSELYSDHAAPLHQRVIHVTWHCAWHVLVYGIAGKLAIMTRSF